MVESPNQNQVYPIGSIALSQPDFYTILRRFPPLADIEQVSIIKGPFDGKINTIYLLKWENAKSLIFRARVSKAFRYEPIVKEKILYPLLDGSLNQNTPNLGQKIEQISETRQGSYVFSTERPSIVPVQNLIYYYEPPENVTINKDLTPFPYQTSIKEYLPGRSLYEIVQNMPESEKESMAICGAFEITGEQLAKLHSVSFDAFYDQITDIGGKSKPKWSELFYSQWNKNFKDASRYSAFQPLIHPVERFLKDNDALVADETEAVLFHNDYQSQNLIFINNENQPYSSSNKFTLSGIIDFDNWRVGPRAQDFVKMEYWTIQGNRTWEDSFYEGYARHFPIRTDFKIKIQIYKMLWFMLVYAFEMDKISKNEQNRSVDSRFPAAEKYIGEIRNLLDDYL
jgi:aminoglycoside phosphotransferase (APT) family kinase protein